MNSQLNTIGKLKDAGIITNNLVVLPNTSNTCLANNGTHVSLDSRLLTMLAADRQSLYTPGVEKYFGDLVIKTCSGEDGRKKPISVSSAEPLRPLAHAGSTGFSQACSGCTAI